MSRRQKIKHMTPEELKTKLYAHFEKTGSLDHLKAQLRGQLVSELFKVADNVNRCSLPTSADVEKCLLPVQMCNWLIYDHMARQNYQYSLSTFVTEAHLPNPEKLLTAGDILGLLGLSPSSTEFQNICKLYTEKNELKCLNSLLLCIMKTLFNIPNKDSLFNQSYNHINAINETSRKELDTFESSLKYKERQSGERSKNASMDKSFLSNGRQSPEKSFNDLLQSVKKESEKEIQKLRHNLLEELENLHSKELEMQMELEHKKSELKNEHSKLIKEREMLKEKEIVLEKEIANKYEQKMRNINADFTMKMNFKDKEIENIKCKLLEKEQKLIEVQSELSNQSENCSIIKKELDDLRHLYKTNQEKYENLLDENRNLLKKFDGMSDYLILKDELSSKSKQILKLQNEIEDMHQKSEIERKKYVETVRSLEDNLNTKEPQLIKAKRELDLMQTTFNSKESMWNREKRKLEQELCEFKELYQQLIQRLEEQKEDIQDLNKTIYILNYKVNNNVSNISKSGSLNSHKKYDRTSEMSLKYKPQSLFTKRTQHSSNIYNDESLKFISDAKTRLDKLNQEENAVQEKYSYVFSTLSESKQSKSAYNDNFSSIHKNNFENYELPSLKDMPSSSCFGFGNYFSNKTKSPYTLTNVKSMVARSLFPSSNTTTDFLNACSKDQNVIRKLNKSVSKNCAVLEETIPKQTTFNKSNQNIVDISNTEIPNMSENVHNASSKTRAENSKSELFSKEKDSDENDSHFLSIPEKRIQRDKTSDLPHSMETINASVQKETINLSNVISAEKINSHNSVTQSSSGFNEQVCINLDAAWKRRTSDTPLQKNTEETILIEKENSSLFKNLQLTEKRHISQLNKNTNMSKLKPIKIQSNSQQSTTFNRNFSLTDYTLNDNRMTIQTDPVNFQNTFTQSAAQILNKNQEQGVSHDTPKTCENTNDVNEPKEIECNVSNNSENVFSKTFSSIKDTICDDNKNTFETGNMDSTVINSVNSDQKINSPSAFESSNNPAAKDCELDAEEYHSRQESLRHGNEKSKKSEEKVETADSLSELSEIHLSCGSETEQQKEDSDAW